MENQIVDLKPIKTCIITVDVEEWFQVENLKGVIKKSDWEFKKSSVEENTLKILDILDKYKISATFFVLGWVAEQKKQLVKTISEKGHEIACHGYSHDLAYTLGEKKLLQDILKSKILLEDIISQPIVGYRAPSFSISDIVLKILKELQFTYDSSYNPFRWNERYGKIDSTLQSINNGCYLTKYGLLEIPLSTFSIFKINIPVGGGAYFRIIPYFIFKRLVKAILEKRNFYTFYIHPWELEPSQEKIKNIKLNFKFRHYYGLRSTEKKFEKILKFLKDSEYKFLKMEQYTDFILRTFNCR